MRTPGDPVDQGLSAKAASELGLQKGTAVGTSLIDAHAGGLGMIGCSIPGIFPNLQSRLGIREFSYYMLHFFRCLYIPIFLIN